jgi:hypothetical protein
MNLLNTIIAVSCFLFLSYFSAIAADCDSIIQKDMFYYCGETKLSKVSEIESALSSCPAASEMYSTARGLGTGSSILTTIGGICLGWNIGNLLFPTTGVIPALWFVGGGCAGIGITMAVFAGTKSKKAIGIYNSHDCAEKSSFRLDLKVSGNALSLCYNF